MSLSTKDPDEYVTVTFDFSEIASAISNPTVSCQNTVFGESAEAMLSGPPQITGLKVLQRIIGGLDGNTYKLRCRIDDADGERWILSDVLTVRSV